MCWNGVSLEVGADELIVMVRVGTCIKTGFAS